MDKYSNINTVKCAEILFKEIAQADISFQFDSFII